MAIKYRLRRETYTPRYYSAPTTFVFKRKTKMYVDAVKSVGGGVAEGVGESLDSFAGKGAAGMVGGATGFMGGASAGAALGSAVCPVIGTAIGAVGGALAGTAVGTVAGRKIAGATGKALKNTGQDLQAESSVS